MIIINISYRYLLCFPQGFWSRFFPIYDRLRSALDDDIIGDIKSLSINFGNNPKKVGMGYEIRTRMKALGGGALLDTGCYTIMFANMVFREKPETIEAESNKLPTGLLIESCNCSVQL